MKLFGKLAAAAAFVIAGVAGVQAQAITEIRIGTEGAYPPFNNLNAQKQLEGFEIDYVNDLCNRIMKVTCTWVVQDWDGIIPALLANKYDIIVAGMNATPERQRRVDFTDIYVASPIAVVTTKANTSNDFSPQATRGKAWGAQGSTIHTNWLEKHYRNATIRPYPTQEEANLDLMNGRVDFLVADREALETFINGRGKDCCRLIGNIQRDPEVHGPGVGMALRKGSDALRTMLNNAIAESKRDGSLDRHAQKWLGKPAIQP
jgi:polar amino acid transport system substrate-binding protein